MLFEVFVPMNIQNEALIQYPEYWILQIKHSL